MNLSIFLLDTYLIFSFIYFIYAFVHYRVLLDYSFISVWGATLD